MDWRGGRLVVQGTDESPSSGNDFKDREETY